MVLWVSVQEGIYAPFTELSEASVYFIHASCGCGALSERSELCGAIANKRMYEIRKRSVFSKRSVYLLQAITFKSFFSLFSFPNLPHQFRQLAIFPGYIAVVLCLMGQLAVRAVFDSLICHSEIPAAFIPQRIQWTIAEQTVKILGICSRMTRKIFTFFVTEKSIMFPFPIWFLHFNTSLSSTSYFTIDIFHFYIIIYLLRSGFVPLGYLVLSGLLASFFIFTIS